MSDYERRSRRSNRPQDEEYNYDDYQSNRNLSGVGGYNDDTDDDWQMSNPEELRSSRYRQRSSYQGQGDMSDYEQGNRRERGNYGYEGGDYGYGYQGGESGQYSQYGMNRRRGSYGYESDTYGQSGMRRGKQMGMGNRRGGRGESGYGDYEGRSYTGGPGTGYESEYDTSYGGQGQYGSGYGSQGQYSSSYRGYEEGQQYGGQMGSQRGGRYAGVGPEGYQRSDQRIEEEVNERLMWHGEIDASKMRVKVNKGEVTLEGTVQDRWQKRMAVDAAHEVRGVKDVHNQLRIQQNQGTESRQNEAQQDREYTDSSATKQQGDRKRQTSSSSSSKS